MVLGLAETDGKTEVLGKLVSANCASEISLSGVWVMLLVCIDRRASCAVYLKCIPLSRSRRALMKIKLNTIGTSTQLYFMLLEMLNVFEV